MEKKKSRIFGLKMSEDIEKKVESIMEKTGIEDKTNAIRYAISFTESKLIPAYIADKANSPERKVYATPEERVRAKEERRLKDIEVKRAMEEEKALDICTMLDGDIVTGANGSKSCKFKLYEKVGPRLIMGEREIPFDMLSPEHVHSQYAGGTKEQILEMKRLEDEELLKSNQS